MTRRGSCACAAVDGDDRRAFLRRSAALAAAVAASFGLRGADAGTSCGVMTGVVGARPEERRYPIPTADGVSIDRENEVIVSRYQNHVYAFALACPHQNTALRWLQAEVRFQCPRHESKYRPDGQFISGRATRSMDRFAVKRDGQELVVDLGRLYQSDAHPAEWAAASVTL
jgi:nitrite reductase/ring-hydroxylating ferredoxin subunit